MRDAADAELPKTSPDQRSRRLLAGARLTALLLLVCGTVLLIGCRQSQAEQQARSSSKPVTTITAQAAALPETATGVGTLAAVEQVEIRPERAGIVRKVLFEEGQRVAPRDLLFQLDDDELQRRHAARQAALESTQADLANAQWKFERIRRLYEAGTAAIEEFKQARDRYRALSAQAERLSAEVEIVEEQLEDTQIRAPLAGRMTEHLVDAGDFVDVGDRLTAVYRTDPLELSVSLSARFADRVRIGQLVTATSPAYPDDSFGGQLTFVSPVVDPHTREFRVKARIPNPDGRLKPGVFATAGVIIDRHAQHPVVPEECLVNVRAGYVIFVVKDGTAHQRDVRPGLRAPGRVEIRSGLLPGEQVVRTGHMQLTDGDAVRIVETHDATTTTEPATQPTTQARN